MSETLYEHCAEIEATAKKRMDVDLAAAYEVLRRDGATGKPRTKLNGCAR